MAKILIVEDNFETIEILRDRLQKKGHKVTLATSSKEAVEAAKTILPDLLVLDLMLVGGDSGLDVLKDVRSEKKLKDKPIIILSNLDSVKDEVFKYEATEYLVKSNTSLSEIENTIEKQLAIQI